MYDKKGTKLNENKTKKNYKNINIISNNFS